MTDVSLVHEPVVREHTALAVHLRRAWHRSRSAIFPRRRVIKWEMQENSRYFDAEIAAAKARKESLDEIEGLRSMEAHEYWVLEEELGMLESNRLTAQAGAYMLPTPALLAGDDDPNWQQGTSFKPTWYLKPQAMQELRALIRAERKARREPVAEWLKIGGAAIGGIGGAIIIVKEIVTLFH